ncbi:PLP-dependent cysteine synthase family protein [Pseudonocardia humida]|uniref:Cysteine synthase family protein n=1 Tax=Pseudonocardia humida TaxID=2800819 RepID=A0ABT1A430_9PSEU|nr:cysteine synthase family protein [Pseudonocardia humida]MCO1657759.1 cysteine synthase family protein [Pseudonocardia humida]
MTIHESVLDAVGETPLVRLNRVTAGLAPAVYGKVEFSNPGGSVKDRAALAMVRDAERTGALPPTGGGVIVEATSGNTGVGLAVVAAQHGHRAVFVVPNTIAREKVTLLRAYGAEVVETIGTLPREHPRHVKNLAARIAEQTPGGWYANQYDNPANPRVHELTTGPEIWRQTDGRVTHLVSGIGTGGTISGTGRFLRGHGVVVVGADPEASVYGGGDGSPYYVESVGHYRHPDTRGEDSPQVYDPAVVDRMLRVPDRESLRMTRRLAHEEGLLVGGSSGCAVAAALRLAEELGPRDLVVVILPDSGRNYLSKYFDDGWLTRLGFQDAAAGPRVRDRLPGAARLPVAPGGTPLAEVLRAHREGPVAVVVARESGDPTRSLPEVLGVVRVEALRAVVDGEPGRADEDVAGHAVPATAVGAGEAVDSAAARLGPAEHVLLLVDGRVVAVHPAELLRG